MRAGMSWKPWSKKVLAKSHCNKSQYGLPLLVLIRCMGRQVGEMAEWSKAHAWKVCIRQRIEGSNPSLSATIIWGVSSVGRAVDS